MLNREAVITIFFLGLFCLWMNIKMKIKCLTLIRKNEVPNYHFVCKEIVSYCCMENDERHNKLFLLENLLQSFLSLHNFSNLCFTHNGNATIAKISCILQQILYDCRNNSKLIFSRRMKLIVKWKKISVSNNEERKMWW